MSFSFFFKKSPSIVCASSSSAMFVDSELAFDLKRSCENSCLTSEYLWVKCVCVCVVVWCLCCVYVHHTLQDKTCGKNLKCLNSWDYSPNVFSPLLYLLPESYLTSVNSSLQLLAAFSLQGKRKIKYYLLILRCLWFSCLHSQINLRTRYLLCARTVWSVLIMFECKQTTHNCWQQRV